ncbi:MAG: tyrosine-type recombinase/integrase [Actinobacteria bacterium]|nr:tyrosine-type recombinase/integrase [Actinomycetota bacterium]MCL5445793.1 tyrosine-type recombinase/integrase [Actinomycetota bacterium]
MTSTFTELAESYVEMRRSLGYRLEGQATYLRSFAGFLDRSGCDGPVPLALSVEWAAATSASDPHNPARRLTVVRGFLRFLASLDGDTEVPPPGLLGPALHRTSPHVYSDEEIASLLRAAAGLSPSGGLRPHCYVTLLSLLACTGLRISEALALSRDDVDLTAGVLSVRAGKGGKSRLVPLHPSALEPLEAYASLCHRYGATQGSDAFFRTERQERLTYQAVRSTFRALRRQLGWSSQGRTRLPRLHDLRHRMVVKRVLLWHAEGVDVDAKIAVLATYLGHTLVSDLYWYFSATPELMNAAAERFTTLGDQVQGGVR